MKNIIIFGLEQFAMQMFHLLKQDSEVTIKGFCVDKKYLPENHRGGILCMLLRIWRIILLQMNTAFSFVSAIQK